MALQILYFVPYNLLQPAPSFAAVSRKLLVSPVLKKLVFLNSPEEVRCVSALTLLTAIHHSWQAGTMVHPGWCACLGSALLPVFM